MARFVSLLRLIGFTLALASYWAPWGAHPVVGLSLAEQDLAEFPKFMPQVRANEIFVQREVFYFPLFVLAVGLVLWAAQKTSEGSQTSEVYVVVRWLMRLCALALPFVSSVFHFYEPSEFEIQRNFALVVAALIVFTPWLRRLPIQLMSGLMFIWFILGALLPTAQYIWMKPAIETIYNRPVQIGWGLWAGLFGFILLALLEIKKRMVP
jgi:hypothetical protein